jgi:polyribonucleotide nucleotidyltransferase
MIDELAAKDPVAKIGGGKAPSAELIAKVREMTAGKIREVKGQPGKHDRKEFLAKVRDDMVKELTPALDENTASYPMIMAQRLEIGKIRNAFYQVEEEITRETILEGVRPDGRGLDDIRPISCSVGILPRIHGSAVFTRGETQALCTVTLGTSSDEQLVDGLADEYNQKFMLHYYFPSYSVGEVRPIRGPGRREIGHGALAERSLLAVLPTVSEFPYTVRVISDIMESNGSSSMASSCGGCLALMDAGVPIKAMVAGISVGLVKQGDQYKLLTDIIGEEDHFGDMDFKVCGTRDGVTAIQLDIKIEGIPHEIIRETLHRARDARFKILDTMAEVIAEPRKQISTYAPRLLTVKIDPEKIGKLIGPGGKNIKALQADTNCNIDIEDDGTVFISSTDAEGAERCKAIVEAMTQSVQIGKIYDGRVVSIKDFGAFVEIAPETDGLCHVSELSDQYVGRVTDVVNMGDEVKVKVLLVDDQGRIKLSRKAAMQELGLKDPERPQGERPQREEGDEGGDRPRRPARSGGGRGGPRRED